MVLQTFSKAWGSAGIRLGMAFASKNIIQIFNKIKYPYNINRLTQEHALELLKRNGEIQAWVKELVSEREILTSGHTAHIPKRCKFFTGKNPGRSSLI